MDGLPGLICHPCRGFTKRELGHHRGWSQQLFDFLDTQVVSSWNHTNEHYSLSTPHPTDGVCNRVVKPLVWNVRLSKFFLDWLSRAFLRDGKRRPVTGFECISVPQISLKTANSNRGT